MRRTIVLALAGVLLLSSCWRLTREVEGGGGSTCIERDQAGSSRTLCIESDGEKFAVTADGLEPGSSVRVESPDGEMNFSAGDDGVVSVQVGALRPPIFVTGTWWDGEEAAIGQD